MATLKELLVKVSTKSSNITKGSVTTNLPSGSVSSSIQKATLAADRDKISLSQDYQPYTGYVPNLIGLSLKDRLGISDYLTLPSNYANIANISDSISFAITYFRNYQDTVNMSESFFAQLFANYSFSNTTNISESLSFDYSIYLEDSINVSSSFSEAFADQEILAPSTASIYEALSFNYGWYLSDDINISEAFDSVTSYIRSYSDTTNVSQSLSFDYSWYLSDDLNVLETIAKTVGKYASDDINVSDSDLIFGYGKYPSDDVQISEAALIYDYGKGLSNTSQISESLSFDREIHIYDYINANQLFTYSGAGAHTVGNTTSITDSISFQLATILNFSHIVNIDQSVIMNIGKYDSDDINVSEAFSRTVSWIRSFDDTINIDESIVKNIGKYDSDDINLSESQIIFDYSKYEEDTVNVDESIAKDIAKYLEDNINVSQIFTPDYQSSSASFFVYPTSDNANVSNFFATTPVWSNIDDDPTTGQPDADSANSQVDDLLLVTGTVQTLATTHTPPANYETTNTADEVHLHIYATATGWGNDSATYEVTVLKDGAAIGTATTFIDVSSGTVNTSGYITVQLATNQSIDFDTNNIRFDFHQLSHTKSGGWDGGYITVHAVAMEVIYSPVEPPIEEAASNTSQISELISKLINKYEPDTVNVSEDIAKAFSTGTWQDNVQVSESFSYLKSIMQYLSDTTNVSDSDPIFDFNKYDDNTVNTSENISKNIGKSDTDDVSISESASAHMQDYVDAGYFADDYTGTNYSF